MAKEIVHFQRFGEALRGVQEKLAEKKFYMNNGMMMNTNEIENNTINNMTANLNTNMMNNNMNGCCGNR